jgi:hypothetical protein
LLHDIRLGLEEVRRVQARIYRAKCGDSASLDQAGLDYVRQYLDVKLYHHCPFSLLFLTNKHAFVEQYYYKNHARHVDVPMMRYSKKELQDEFRTSFEVIWENAKAGILKDSEVGTASTIEHCTIKSIFSKRQRTQSAERQAETLIACDNTTTIKIMSISGKFYRSAEMITKLMGVSDHGGAVQFLLLNPICCQAVLRAIADDYPHQICEELATWNWQKHHDSRLYTDTDQTISELKRRMDAGYRFKVKLHHSAPACSLFLTQKEAFTEQYIYGRSKASTKDQVLGAEYPLFEFGRKETNKKVMEETDEMQMLESTFDIIWKAYSIDIVDYLALRKEEQFGKTLEDLGRWKNVLAGKASDRLST